MIYADHAATHGSIAPEIQKAVADYLCHPVNPGHSTSQAAIQTEIEIFKTRQSIADFFGFAHPERVIFCSGATQALNQALNWIAKGDHIITTWLEHNAVLRPLYQSQASLSFTNGTLKEIQQALRPETKAVILSHVSNVTGQIQDLKAIGTWCKEHNLYFIVDAAQSAGILDIDMEEMHISALAFSGHKGPGALQGIGALLVQPELELQPLITGGTGSHSFDHKMPETWPEHLEAGTLNVPGILSLQAAFSLLSKEKMAENRKKLEELSAYFEAGCLKNSRIHLLLDASLPHLGVFTMNIEGIDAANAADILERSYGIITRAGAFCAPKVLEHYGCKNAIRFSFGEENTREELDCILEAIEAL